MQERNMSSGPDQRTKAGHPDASEAAATTVPTSLIEAVMDVDAAIDDGGLQLQEALARMHEELAHIIPGPDEGPGTRGPSDAPVSPEHSSSRT